MRRNICFVTGSRAEYGLLQPLMRAVVKDPDLQMQLVVTGAHLVPDFGLTYKTIEQDGFVIDEKIDMLLSSDSSVGVVKSMGLGMIGFADAFERLKPDLLVLLGDRYEILAAAQVALICRIPVAHIAGGDITEGVFDDAIRHSITKMSHIHFVTNEDSRQVVCQLGESPKNVFNVGSLGIDQIKSIPILSRNELEQALDFEFKNRNILVTFHPVTLDKVDSALQFLEVLKAIDNLGRDTGVIFTKPNADPDGRLLSQMIDKFVATHDNAKAYASLGTRLYFSCISQVDVVVGNSSSGLYEVPSFNKPTVNIGDRQKGRMYASSIVNCSSEADAIRKAIVQAFNMSLNNTVNPYGNGDTAARIIKVIKELPDFKSLLKKEFCKVNVSYE